MIFLIDFHHHINSQYRQCNKQAQKTRLQTQNTNPEGLEGKEHQSEADMPRAQALFPITGRRSQGESFRCFVLCLQNSVAFAVWYSKQEHSTRAASGQAAAWGTPGVRGLQCIPGGQVDTGGLGAQEVLGGC